MNFKYSGFLFIILGIIGFFDSEAALAQQTVPKTIRVSIHDLWPTVFLDEQGTPRGFLVDILDEIGRKESWRLEYLSDEWQIGLERLKNGDIDLKVSIAYTPERDRIYDFSEEPAYLDWGEVIVHDSGIRNILDLKNRKVAITKQGFFPIEFQKMCKTFEIAPQFVWMNTDEEILQAVATKKVDAGIVPHVFAVLNEHAFDVHRSPIIFAPIGVFFATPEGQHADVLETIDRYLARWKQDQSSLYYELIDTWFYSEKSRSIIPRWLFVALFSSGGLLLLLFTWTRLLRIQVKRQTSALRESETKYRVLFETFPLGIMVSDPVGRIVETNAMAEDILGIPRQEQVHRTLDDQKWKLVRPDGTPMPATEYAAVRALREHCEITHIEMGLVNAQEHITWLDVNAAPIPLENYGVVVIYGDISTRKQAEERLKSSLAEKEILLRELYHRTKNTLQVIRSMLLLQAARTPDNEQVQTLVTETENRIMAMALVHQKLYQSQDLSRIPIKDYFEELAQLILHSSTPTTGNISLRVDVDPFSLLLDTAIPCGLILNELLSNTLKYAFPDQQPGEISIRMFRNESDTITFIYADNGIGVPPEFDFRKQVTLGLQTVFAIAEQQMQGHITFSSEQGVSCTIEFPDTLYTERV